MCVCVCVCVCVKVCRCPSPFIFHWAFEVEKGCYECFITELQQATLRNALSSLLFVLTTSEAYTAFKVPL